MPRLLAEMENILQNAPRYLDVASPTSEVSRLQPRLSERGEAVVSEDFFHYVSQYLRIARQVPRALDPCMGDLLELWDFRTPRRTLPDPTVLAERLAARGQGFGLALGTGDPARRVSPKLVLSASTGRKLDFSAILVGFAVDEAAAVLRQEKVRRARIDAGGVTYALGTGPDGGAWRVGVPCPRSPSAPLCIVAASDCAVATVGDWQQFFMLDGRRYHALLDPSTGMPATRALSASVRAPSAAMAEALAHAAMVEGATFLARLPAINEGLILPRGSLQALLVLPDGGVVHSSGWNWIIPPPERVEVRDGTNGTDETHRTESR